MVISFCAKRLLTSRNHFLKIPKRNGYIILVPEIGEEVTGRNPLLKDDKFPEFNNITIEKCIATIGTQTLQFEEQIKDLEAKLERAENPDIINDVLLPLEEIYTPLEITWGVAKTLYFGNQSLMPTQTYLSINERANRASAARVGNKTIYNLCKNASQCKDLNLSDEERRLLSKYVIEGKLNGLELSEKKRKEYAYAGGVILKKQSEFRQKLEIATKLFTETVRDPDVMHDFPQKFLKATAVDPSQPNAGPWTITLRPNIYHTFMAYCPERRLRWKVWEAYVTRASLYNDKHLQNSTPLEEMRYQRNSQATILGFRSFADMSMETKMAGTLENVYDTLDTLLEAAKPVQEQEIQELTEFAQERGLDGSIRIWDIPFWSRKQCCSVYNYQEDVIRGYFPLPNVLKGLFDLIESLFSIQIVERKKIEAWHKDVRFFDIFDSSKQSIEPIASFYLDLYERGGEKVLFTQQSGWMVGIKGRSKISGTTPLAALIFNFQLPVEGKPSLLSFEDVKTLFRKFGHALHHLLTTVEYGDLSGLSYVDWDAAYITDYFMENWLYEPSVLEQISSHHETKEPLPPELIRTLIDIRSFFAGYKLCHELYLSKLDLELHSSNEFWAPMMTRLWDKYFVFPSEKKDSHVCSFEEIFAGSFGAAYYSFLWSEMIAADAFSAFQEASSKDKEHWKEVGNRYRNTFLSLGGSYPSAEIFRRFRGRDPSAKALIRNLGLERIAKQQSSSL